MLNSGGLPPGEGETKQKRSSGVHKADSDHVHSDHVVFTLTTSCSLRRGHSPPAAGRREIAALQRDLEVFLLYNCSCWQSCSSEFQVYLIILLISHKGTSFLGDLLIVVQILLNRCILQLFCFFGFPIP